uniref:Uncharacterized protein n=1 Tax=Canis lupus familiaris TaxID=9615 RepID=A0A8C0SWD0_CANLF
MRKSNRTTEYRTILSILHSNRIPASPSSTALYPKHHRLPKFPYNSILNSAPTKLLIQHLFMISMHNSLYRLQTLLPLMAA